MQKRPLLHRIWFFIKFLEIRLRFVAILVVTALIVGYWDHIQNHYERWQRRHAEPAGTHQHGAAESQYEFFCPMHPFVVREAAGKCPICGMDLVQRKRGAPVSLPAGTLTRVQVSPERIMQAGVQVEPVAYRLLIREARTYGVIEPDETLTARIAGRFPGRIEKLMVNAVGMNVTKGEPLARIYSPRFLAAAQEYVQALTAERQASGASADEKRRATQLSAYARQRLLQAGFTEEQLNAIREAGKVPDTLTLYSPLSGTVLEKKALEGDVVEESSDLYTIADLSRVWVQVFVIESDLSAIRPNMPVEITTAAYPGEIFYGNVDFIYPTVTAESRSAKVRVVIDNHSGKLKPGMYATAAMRSPVGRYGPPESFNDEDTTATTPTASAATGPAPKLPTATQEDAQRFLASLPVGAAFYQCPMDTEVISDKPDDCPKCGMHLEQKHQQAKPAGEIARTNEPSTQRWVEGWSCPMHPDELSEHPGLCTICNCGMKLERIRLERALSVPESAVIDTGARKIVYAEVSHGVYDAREVSLGQRAGAFYPVLGGLQIGDRIVERGSFLIDAEARLNPSVAGVNQTTGPGEHQH